MRDTENLWDGESRMYGIENPAFNTSLRLAKSESTNSTASLASSSSEQEQLVFKYVQRSEDSVKKGDWQNAVRHYSRAISLDPRNHILYSNRSAAYLHLGNGKAALEDALTARNLQPCWAKAHAREAAALEKLGRTLDAVAAHADAVSLDPSSNNLLDSLICYIQNCELVKKFIDLDFRQLDEIGLSQSASVVLALIGQRLVSCKQYPYAIRILEAALRVKTSSLRLRSSIFSTLARAHYSVGELEKAIVCMQQDCAASAALHHIDGQFRAYSNLGVAFYKKGQYSDAIDAYKNVLSLATRVKQHRMALHALSNLGYLYTAKMEFADAIAAHRQAILVARTIKDRHQEAKEMGNVGTVFLVIGDCRAALACHSHHLLAARNLKDKFEEARAYSNMGAARHRQKRYEDALSLYTDALNIAQDLENIPLQLKAYDGLGLAARCSAQLAAAQKYHEKQLDLALNSRQKSAEARACSNLGILFSLLNEHEAALKLHSSHARIALKLGDKGSECQAMFNMANCLYNLGQLEKATSLYEKVLTTSRKLHDKHIESNCHCHIAQSYESLRMYQRAAEHFELSIKLCCELKDCVGEAKSANLLARLHSSTGHLTACPPLYERCVALWQQANEPIAEANAWKTLAECHTAMCDFEKASEYLGKALSLARASSDISTVCGVYCSLSALKRNEGKLDESLEYAEKAFEIAKSSVNLRCLYIVQKALGESFSAREDYDSAVRIFHQLVNTTKSVGDKKLECEALSLLGANYKNMIQIDKSLNIHKEELRLAQELNDLKFICTANSRLGDVLLTLDEFPKALTYFEEQAEKARIIGDFHSEATAYGNMAICRMNMGQITETINLLEDQINTLDKLPCAHMIPTILLENAQAYLKLGDCYENLDDFDEAIKSYEKNLALAINAKSALHQSNAYRKLGNAHRAVGNLHQALVCFEKRLVLAHEYDDVRTKGTACGELGCLHSLLGNLDQAVSYLEQQLRIAKSENDLNLEADAACGLGGVFQQMGVYEKALEYHELDLSLAKIIENSAAQCRAFGNLGLANESLGQLEKAFEHQQKHLNCASAMNDGVAQTLALSSLGRIQYALGKHDSAIDYLRKGLDIAQELGRTADQAKIHHRLGLALFARGTLTDALHHLSTATELLDDIRRDSQLANEYRLSLFDLQTAALHAQLRVLVALNRIDDALVLAEQARTRALIELMLERQGNISDMVPIIDVDIVRNAVVEHGRHIVYMALAAGFLHVWLLSPKNGSVLNFFQIDLNELESTDNDESQSMRSAGAASLLDQYISQARNSLGVDSHIPLFSSARSSMRLGGRDIGSDDDDDDDKPSDFLRLLRRSHISNKSVYSRISTSSKRSFTSLLSINSNNSCPFVSLYNLFFSKLDDSLKKAEEECHLTLVLQADLYLVPWPLLRPGPESPYLFERFSLLIAPSLRALTRNTGLAPSCGGLVIGPPSPVPPPWYMMTREADDEARMVSDIMGWRCMSAGNATKQAVIKAITGAEVLHFVVHVSWRLSAIILAVDSRMQLNEDSILPSSILTASDLLDIKLRAKLVVLSTAYSQDRGSTISADGLLAVTRAFLAAGASTVLVSLWPVPGIASRGMMKALYGELIQGIPITQALSQSQKILKHSPGTSHASNWAGWIIVGVDNPTLSSHTALLADALACMLKSAVSTNTPKREAMRVVLHLVEKSLQRMNHGEKRAMYTPVSTLQQRIGQEGGGWKELLSSVGFRLEMQQQAVYFFPSVDPGQRLARCSAALQALLALPALTLVALSKLLDNPVAARELHQLLRSIDRPSSSTLSLKLHVHIWRAEGCHELLASLGFDLIDVKGEEVSVRASRQATRRMLQLTVHALAALFDTAPSHLSLDSSSSIDSPPSSPSSPLSALRRPKVSNIPDSTDSEQEEMHSKVNSGRLPSFVTSSPNHKPNSGPFMPLNTSGTSGFQPINAHIKTDEEDESNLFSYPKYLDFHSKLRPSVDNYTDTNFNVESELKNNESYDGATFC
ncbi:DgyrCDS9482 [Dimorphilus gyrociliatus]|uniref:DgyrCDS9482 n=1 Tax=Dimorphilus gyrociliatus TaxID=2664684 RepID=A0A7I8VZA5_9ANNE|nr:DgyrCDS9482 [Dimorphilus gyrociliatus]